MDVIFWTVFGCIAVVVLAILNYSSTWKRGPYLIQRTGILFFGGIKRTLILYVLLVSIVFWTAKSYLSGFRLGLGVGITSEVTASYLLISMGEWMFIILAYGVLVAGLYRHPSFQWVFPPYSHRLASIWIFRARTWIRYSESLKRFLLMYHMKVEDTGYEYYQEAIQIMAKRSDWIGSVAQDVLSSKINIQRDS